MIRYINLDSYKIEKNFCDFYDCLSHFGKMILDDYETSKIEIETLIPFTYFSDDFKLYKIPSNGSVNKIDYVINIEFTSLYITNKGISIHCKISK